ANSPRKVLAGHTGRVFAVAFTADGRTLASASEDRTVRLWSVETGEAVAILQGDRGGGYAGGFAPPGRPAPPDLSRILASGDKSGEVRLWWAAAEAETASSR